MVNRRGAMENHYKKDHSEQVSPKLPFTTKVIKTCIDWVDRKICEAVEIKHKQPEINTQQNINK